MEKEVKQDAVAEPMSSSYADGLSPYDHKGKLGLQEVNLMATDYNFIYVYLILCVH
jgi:hypothetical protein